MTLERLKLSTLGVAALLISGLALSACDKSGDAGETTDAAATPATTAAAEKPADDKDDPVKEANKLYKRKCETCHGATGTGDGAGAAALAVKPRNYSDSKWQASATDKQIKDIILKGGASVGLDAAMPGTPALRKKPKVLDALVAKIRGFAKPGAAPAAAPADAKPADAKPADAKPADAKPADKK